MTKPGPAPKPVELKLVEGNPGRRPLPEVPKPTIAASAPKPPAVLGAEGKKLWNRIAPELHRLGLLTDLDLEGLVALCVSWEQARAAAELIRKQGIVVDLPVFRKDGEIAGYRTQRHPAAQTLRDSLTQFKAFAAEFGLTPSARTKFSMPKGQEVDELEGLLD